MPARSHQILLKKIDPVAVSIFAKLTCYWDLHETSGSRVDQVNGINLTSTGTVSSAQGPRGSGDVAQGFAGASELDTASLGSSSVASIPAGGGSHCIFGWYFLTANTSNQALFGRWNASAPATMEFWSVAVSGAPNFYNGGSAYVNASVTAPAANAWHFFVGWRDSSDGKVRVCVDNGTVGASSGASNPTAQTENGQFASIGASDRMTGRLSRWGWIKGAFLSATEITWMYNSGQGRDYAEIKSLAGH